MGVEENYDEMVMKSPLIRRDDAIAWSMLTLTKTDSTAVPLEDWKRF